MKDPNTRSSKWVYKTNLISTIVDAKKMGLDIKSL